MNIQKKSPEESQRVHTEFSEVEEYNHERNPVAAAQKQMSSQETAGLLEDE
jgi:hypothetical protein